MNNSSFPDKEWIRSHLPEDIADQPVDFFTGMYLEGLTVKHCGERGEPDWTVLTAQNEDDLRYWQLENVCRFIKEKNPPVPKTWRYCRDYAKDGRWYYIEHRRYDYNTIEDSRLYGFERFLRNLRPSLPPERWEQRVLECVGLMNRWFKIPHWDYDRDNLHFVEISSSRPYRSDSDDTEEPAPDSISQLID